MEAYRSDGLDVDVRGVLAVGVDGGVVTEVVEDPSKEATNIT
jgi:hypothetical protein